jgi:hypothetical protein
LRAAHFVASAIGPARQGLFEAQFHDGVLMEAKAGDACSETYHRVPPPP